ncbi:hypothetical protein Pcinc_033037 [Petrolisthes cinctipes]|uniref:Uncharacterized protein n=1 Tax=Petrolisthes cinctipes TaxID=88211 RepID=A0AAE1ET98_PETCI|nr:hypothetical protein Pcinc_033037 [Petrolisthes cinctipes]
MSGSGEKRSVRSRVEKGGIQAGMNGKEWEKRNVRSRVEEKGGRQTGSGGGGGGGALRGLGSGLTGLHLCLIINSSE